MRLVRIIIAGITTVAGIMLALVGGLMFLFCLCSLSSTHWCRVTGGITEVRKSVKDVGHREVQIQTPYGTTDDAWLSKSDQHAYQTGDMVLVDFPFGPPCVLSDRDKLMHYLFDYPTVVVMGILVCVVGLWIGLGKRSTSCRTQLSPDLPKGAK